MRTDCTRGCAAHSARARRAQPKRTLYAHPLDVQRALLCLAQAEQLRWKKRCC